MRQALIDSPEIGFSGCIYGCVSLHAISQFYFNKQLKLLFYFYSSFQHTLSLTWSIRCFKKTYVKSKNGEYRYPNPGPALH
jgi:hypothetical protein